MKVRLQDSFVKKLNRHVALIAKDRPTVARKFKNDLLSRIKSLSDNPNKYKKSIYFENDFIRDMTFKGYTIVYKIDQSKSQIIVFGFTKHQEKL
ncbi:MAG: type II toxin-antitoxin system RelE/ParE family toxin [Bacteroidota bacterium]